MLRCRCQDGVSSRETYWGAGGEGSTPSAGLAGRSKDGGGQGSRPAAQLREQLGRAAGGESRPHRVLGEPSISAERSCLGTHSVHSQVPRSLGLCPVLAASHRGAGLSDLPKVTLAGSGSGNAEPL